jgi:hypothetical protein
VRPAEAVVALRVEVSRAEALRYLGYPGGEPRTAGVASRLDAMWEGAVASLDARGAYRVVDAAAALGAGMPAPAERVGVAVCTIGPALEAEAARLTAAGRLIEALLLEAIGSAAAEAAADELNLKLCHVALDLGLRAAARLSPGYGGWHTAAQRELLALLPLDALGIALTDGCMMVPRKSVSFAASFVEPSALQSEPGSPCRLCGLPRCRHRIAAYEGPVADCG